MDDLRKELEEAGIDPNTMESNEEQDNAESNEEPDGEDEHDSEPTEEREESSGDGDSERSEDDGRSDASEEELTVDGISFKDAPPDMKRAMRTALKDTKQLKEDLARQKELSESILSKLAQPAQPETQEKEPELPDKSLYPDEYAVELAERTQKQLEEVTKKQEALQSEQQARAGLRAIEDDFTSQTPDYGDAKEFLLDMAVKQLQIQSPGTPMSQLRQFAENKFLVSADAVLGNNQDPAEVAYKTAVLQGYKQDMSQKPNLRNIKKNSEKASSLGSTSGAPAKGSMTLQRLDAMPGREMESWIEKNPDKFRALMDSQFAQSA